MIIIGLATLAASVTAASSCDAGLVFDADKDLAQSMSPMNLLLLADDPTGPPPTWWSDAGAGMGQDSADAGLGATPEERWRNSAAESLKRFDIVANACTPAAIDALPLVTFFNILPAPTPIEALKQWDNER